MNTTKAVTQSTKTQSVNSSHGMSKKNRAFFLNYCHLFVYIFSLIMFVISFACLFIKGGNYNCYFYKDSISGGGIAILIFSILSIICAFMSFFINRIIPNKSKFSYMIKDIIFINLAILFLILTGCFTGRSKWLWNDTNFYKSISVGGAYVIVSWVIYSLYLVWSQISHFHGEKIKAWFKKHNPIKSKKA